METEHLSLETIELLSDKDNDCIDGSAEFEITGRSQIHFETAIAMFMCKLNIVNNILVEDHSITFTDYTMKNGFSKLPFPLDTKGVIDFASNWLRQLQLGSKSKLPDEPDHDGSNSYGWKISTTCYDRNLKISFRWLEHHK